MTGLLRASRHKLLIKTNAGTGTLENGNARLRRAQPLSRFKRLKPFKPDQNFVMVVLFPMLQATGKSPDRAEIEVRGKKDGSHWFTCYICSSIELRPDDVSQHQMFGKIWLGLAAWVLCFLRSGLWDRA